MADKLLPHEAMTVAIAQHRKGHDQIAFDADIVNLRTGKISRDRLYEIRSGDVEPYARELRRLARAMGPREFLPVMMAYFDTLYRIRPLTELELNGDTQDEAMRLMVVLGEISDKLLEKQGATNDIYNLIEEMRDLLDRLQAELSGVEA